MTGVAGVMAARTGFGSVDKFAFLPELACAAVALCAGPWSDVLACPREGPGGEVSRGVKASASGTARDTEGVTAHSSGMARDTCGVTATGGGARGITGPLLLMESLRGGVCAS